MIKSTIVLLASLFTGQLFAATGEQCASFTSSWQSYYPVYQQGGQYFQCLPAGSVPIELTEALDAERLALFAQFDSAYLAQRDTPDASFIEAFELAGLVESEFTIADETNNSGRANLHNIAEEEIAIRMLLAMFSNLDYETSAQLADEYLSGKVFSRPDYLRTAVLISMQSAFSSQQFALLRHHCSTNSVLTAYSPAQQAVMLSLCGFGDVVSGDQQETLRAGLAKLQQAQQLSAGLHDPLLCAQVNNGLASYYLATDDVATTGQYLEAGMHCVLTPHGLMEEEMLDDLTSNLAWVYRQQGNLPGYLSMLRASVYQHTHHLAPQKLLISHSNLGKAYLLVGDAQKSERYYQQALAVAETHNIPDEIDALLALARLRIGKHDYQSAQSYLQRAENLSLTPYQQAQADVLFMQIRVSLSPHDFDERGFLTHLDTIQHHFSPQRKYHLYSDWLTVLQILHRFDLALPIIGDLEQADRYPLSVKLALANTKLQMVLEHKDALANAPLQREQVEAIFNDAFAHIIEASTQFKSTEVGMSWLSQSHTLINHYLSWLLPSKDDAVIERALMVSEQFASIIFKRHRMALIQPDESEEKTALWEEWALANTVMVDPSTSTGPAALLQQDKIWEQIQLSGTGKDDMQWQSSDFSLADIRAQLGKKRVLLKIFALENKNCAYLIAKMYIDQQCTLSPDALTNWITTQLFQFHGFKTVYLMPEGQWRNMSFAALTDLTGKRYLGFEMSVVRVMSLLDYFADIDNDNQNDSIVAFTNPANPPTNALDNQAALQWRAGFPPLPWTAQASKAIANAFPHSPLTVFTDREASNTNLVSAEARHAALLHVGSHAYYLPESPETVGLVTAVNHPDDPGDGFIAYENLFSNRFQNRLVVISACETEMGKSYQGIGMRSLSHGFLYQGAGATISTLWKVPDRATAEFMGLFYQALAVYRGDIGRAMLEARVGLASKRRFRDPRYWAGFVFTTTGPTYERLALTQ